MAEIVIPVRLTADDLDAIATAVAAKLQQNFAPIYEQEQIMSAELDALTAQVHANSSVVDSAVALIGGLADQIRALADDPVALRALADELQQKDAALAAAVAANTPAPPPAP